jgi:hypothetical protein
MDLLESQRLFETDAPRFSRCNKAKIANKEDFPLENLLYPQPFQFMRQRGSHGKAQIGGQRGGADG